MFSFLYFFKLRLNPKSDRVARASVLSYESFVCHSIPLFSQMEWMASRACFCISGHFIWNLRQSSSSLRSVLKAASTTVICVNQKNRKERKKEKRPQATTQTWRLQREQSHLLLRLTVRTVLSSICVTSLGQTFASMRLKRLVAWHLLGFTRTAP